MFFLTRLKKIMQNDKNFSEDIKPDLKHDSMEYAASTDGDDIMDPDLNGENDEVTAEELDILESDTPDEQAEALNSAESDRQSDNDVMFDVNDIEEEYDEDEDEDDENGDGTRR